MSLNENAIKWVEALRSGKYKQGRRVMHNLTDDTYCCLGVACEIFNDENPGVLNVEERVSKGATVRVFNNYASGLPLPVQDWIGLSDLLGCYRPKKNESRGLWAHNDVEKLDFKAIADIIESEPKGLFVK